MLVLTSTMLHYAHTGNSTYYAQNYAGIICQGLARRPLVSYSGVQQLINTGPGDNPVSFSLIL